MEAVVVGRLHIDAPVPVRAVVDCHGQIAIDRLLLNLRGWVYRVAVDFVRARPHLILVE